MPNHKSSHEICTGAFADIDLLLPQKHVGKILLVAVPVDAVGTIICYNLFKCCLKTN